MTLPTGTITMAQVNAEIQQSPSAYITLNDEDVRTIADIPSGYISMNDLRGKAFQFQATGGTVYNGPNYVTHVFTSSGTFEVISGGADGAVNYVIIGGGGGAAGRDSNNPDGSWGNGGAGGYRSGTTNLSVGSYPIGVGGAGPSYNNGGNSSAFSLTAYGGGAGGGGANFYPKPGNDGGSGGGGGCGDASPNFCCGERGFGGNAVEGTSQGTPGSNGTPFISFTNPPGFFPQNGRAPGQGGRGGGALYANNAPGATYGHNGNPPSVGNNDLGVYLPSEVGPHVTTGRVAGGGKLSRIGGFGGVEKDPAPGCNSYGGGGATRDERGKAGLVTVTYFI